MSGEAHKMITEIIMFELNRMLLFLDLTFLVIVCVCKLAHTHTHTNLSDEIEFGCSEKASAVSNKFYSQMRLPLAVSFFGFYLNVSAGVFFSFFFFFSSGFTLLLSMPELFARQLSINDPGAEKCCVRIGRRRKDNRKLPEALRAFIFGSRRAIINEREV